MASLRPGRRGLLVAALAGYGVLAVAAILGLLWSGLDPAGQSAVAAAVTAQAAALAVVAVLALAGFIAALSWVLGRYSTTARRLTAETRLLLHANPDHRLDGSGPAELVELASAVNELADHRSAAARDVAASNAAATAGLEQERNRLATLMSELAVAVVVCTVDGRILLYNATARSLVTDEAAVGLGRSVFGIVDRALFDYAIDRIAATSVDGRTTDGSAADGSAADGSAATDSGVVEVQVATTVRGEQLLRVHLGAVLGPDRAVTGFVLLLEDLTDRMAIGDRRDALLRQLTEGTRASLGSIQAAIETVVGYPEMDSADRDQFLTIIREETQGLGRQVQHWVAESASLLGADYLVTGISGSDLLAVVGRAVEREGGVTITRQSPAETFWVRADSHAIAQSLAYLTGRLRQEYAVASHTLSATRLDNHAQIEMRWTGGIPAPEVFAQWLAEPMGGAGTSVGQVVERHGGEIWCAGTADGPAHLRVLLPLAGAPAAATTKGPTGNAAPAAEITDVSSRPEFYDFQLFDRPTETARWHDRALADIEYTVFDTETTGLSPHEGDEIISMGAVRVVNGRLLHHEQFERLVDPKRSIPGTSTAIHGITAEMVAGQPTIGVVLSEFARYAQDTVLVGHNVGFDMQFLRIKENETGVSFTQPVLDTLLLDAVVHPDHDTHSLEAIAARLGVDILGRHTAVGDALVTGKVFLRLLALLRSRGIMTLGEAVQASRATLAARLDESLYVRRKSASVQRSSQ
jgi:DNA polymerase-3 subunit epsilon